MKTKPEVHYQPYASPDGEKCAACSMFRKPGRCTLVEGKISPAGYCDEWVKK